MAPDTEQAIKTLIEAAVYRARQTQVLTVRVEAIEKIVLMMGNDLCNAMQLMNSAMKFGLFKPGVDLGRMRRDLEEIWKRWKTLAMVTSDKPANGNDPKPPGAA